MLVNIVDGFYKMKIFGRCNIIIMMIFQGYSVMETEIFVYTNGNTASGSYNNGNTNNKIYSFALDADNKIMGR